MVYPSCRRLLAPRRPCWRFLPAVCTGGASGQRIFVHPRFVHLLTPEGFDRPRERLLPRAQSPPVVIRRGSRAVPRRARRPPRGMRRARTVARGGSVGSARRRVLGAVSRSSYRAGWQRLMLPRFSFRRGFGSLPLWMSIPKRMPMMISSNPTSRITRVEDVRRCLVFESGGAARSPGGPAGRSR